MAVAITSVTNQEEKYIQPYLDKGMNVVNLEPDLKENTNSDRRLNKCAAFFKS
jgi:hypothetical protein